MLVLLALIWGASFVFIKLAVKSPEAPYNFPPVTLVGIRLGVAAMLLYGVLKQQGKRFAWSQWPSIALLGLLNSALPYFLFSWSVQLIDSNLASIYNATTPLFTIILAWLFVREERLSGLRSFGVVLGFVGIVYLFSENLGGGQSVGKRHMLGEIACVGAAFSYGLCNIWVRRRLKNLDALQLSTGQMLFGALWTVPAIVAWEEPWRTLAPSASAISALLTLSVIGTGLAMLLYFQLLTQVGATRTSQVTYLMPISGLLWGQVLGEQITPRIIGAMAIVLIGVLIVNGGLDRVLGRKPIVTPASPTAGGKHVG
jgi:drug/metabolite transporter (DMT)-like permease